MNKLKEEELLKYLDDMRELWKMERLPLIDYNPKVEEQAYQQIKEMIQKPEMTKEFIDEQVDLIYRRVAVYTQNNVFPFEDVIKEAIRRTIKEMPAKKLTVTKAFVEKWNQIIAEKVNVQMKKDFIRQEISLVYPGTENLTQMLKEAEIEVVKKPTVPKAFVENMTSRMEQMMMQTQKREDREYFIRCEVLRAAGVEEE